MNGIGRQRTRAIPRSYCRAHRSSTGPVASPVSPVRACTAAPVEPPITAPARWIGGLFSWVLLTAGTYTVLSTLLH